MFIKEYTIMNYETTKHRSRTGQEAQQGCKITQAIRGEPGSGTFGERMWDIATASVSLCSRGRKFIQDAANSRRERSGDCKIASKCDQGSPEVKQKDKRKYQRDHNRSDKGLFKKAWDVREIIDRWSLSMSSIG